MQVAKVCVEGSSNHIICTKLSQVLRAIEEDCLGEIESMDEVSGHTVTIEFIEMSQEEIDALEDFEGF
jgi:hypothetical protein